MEAFQIDDVRGFMGHMLQKDTFDDLRSLLGEGQA